MKNYIMAQLPFPDIYRAAVLVPDLVFSDPDLQSAEVDKNANGLALVWSGQNATVFRLLKPPGRIAVRCFTSQISDRQDRYAELHAHISGKQAPMLVDFQYQQNGIRINGLWYPIVKMEWADGVTLDQKVEECVSKRDIKTLKSLAAHWLNLVHGLQQLKIAHGDLQHENVMVSNDYLRLVDYDGAFVPSLDGKSASEVGHPHYKHPQRKTSDFNLAIDNFPALVIYLSLKALSVDLDLWATFHKDKHLLFLEDDFKTPHKSQLFSTLKQSTDAEVRNLAAKLETACTSQLSAVPILSSITKKSISLKFFIDTFCGFGLKARVSDWKKSWIRIWKKSWIGVKVATPFQTSAQTSTQRQPWWLNSNPAVSTSAPINVPAKSNFSLIVPIIGVIFLLFLAFFAVRFGMNGDNSNSVNTNSYSNSANTNFTASCRLYNDRSDQITVYIRSECDIYDCDTDPDRVIDELPDDTPIRIIRGVSPIPSRVESYSWIKVEIIKTGQIVWAANSKVKCN